MQNVYKNLPVDKFNAPMQELPAPFLSQTRYTSENATASSVITVTDNTTSLEVAAIGVAAALRWVTTADTQASIITVAGATANYDHVIPAGTYRRFAIPVESMPQASIVGANKLNGLYNRVAIKSMGIGSVLTSEF